VLCDFLSIINSLAFSIKLCAAVLLYASAATDVVECCKVDVDDLVITCDISC